jgi:hypothetical protein
MIIFLSILLEWKMIKKKRCRENQDSHFMFNKCLLKILPFCEKMSKNIVDPGRPQMTIQSLRTAGWIPKSANTHKFRYIILIAFPLQQWLHECSYIHTYIPLHRLCYHHFPQSVKAEPKERLKFIQTISFRILSNLLLISHLTIRFCVIRGVLDSCVLMCHKNAQLFDPDGNSTKFQIRNFMFSSPCISI